MWVPKSRILIHGRANDMNGQIVLNADFLLSMGRSNGDESGMATVVRAIFTGKYLVDLAGNARSTAGIENRIYPSDAVGASAE
jgi:hypothetical protein